MARAIVNTIKHFLASSDSRIAEKHVPAEYEDQYEKLAFLSRRFWKSIQTESALSVSHDVYLKAWQLSAARVPGSDVVLYDEAQDCTPALIAVVEQTPRLQRLYVGDSHQHIYQFRGTENALTSLDLPLLPLTETWRFGRDIANAANALLKAKGETLALRPAVAQEGQVFMGHPPHSRGIVLARTNVGLIEWALRVIGEHGKPFIRGERAQGSDGMVSGAGALVAALLEAYDLWRGKRRFASGSRFSMFESWEDLRAASEEDDGQAYRPYVRIVDRYRGQVPTIVSRLRNDTAKSEGEADVILSTVHRYKGEESETVALADDFFDLIGRDSKGRPRLDVAEANIAYVALTRAKKELWLGGAYDRVNPAVRWKTGANVPVSRQDQPQSSRVGGLNAAIASIRRPLSMLLGAALQRVEAQSYGDYEPGGVWTHPVYGDIVIVSANSQTIKVRLSTGEEKELATLASIAKLHRK